MRSAISSADEFRVWCAKVTPGVVCIYHLGNVARDRVGNVDLDQIADTARILGGIGYLTLGQHPVQLSTGTQTAYTAQRNQSRPGVYAPSCILRNTISPKDYLALIAIAQKPPRMSAQRAIRDNLTPNESIADEIVRRLKRKGYLIRTHNGFEISDDARRLIFGAGYV